jgi:hypothetical protein
MEKLVIGSCCKHPPLGSEDDELIPFCNDPKSIMHVNHTADKTKNQLASMSKNGLLHDQVCLGRMIPKQIEIIMAKVQTHTC